MSWQFKQATECTCGSRKPRYELVDAAGIFCNYVCEDCESGKRQTYNPAIFEAGAYAMTGDEEDLWQENW